MSLMPGLAGRTFPNLTPLRPRSLVLAALLAAALSLATWPAAGHEGYSKELQRLSERLLKRPKDAKLRLDRVRLYRRMGDLAGAVADIRVVQHQQPELPRLFLERALTREALGNVRGAEADLSRYLSSKKPVASAWAARARIRQQRKNWAGAISDYGQAIRRGPTPDLVLARGALQERLGKHADAAKGYRAALTPLGGALVVRLALIRVQRKLRRFPAALTQVNAILARAPIKTDYLLLRGEIYEEAGKAALAKKNRIAALKQADGQLAHRDTALSRLSRAKALHALGRKADARNELRRVLKKSPRLEEARALAEAWGVGTAPAD